MTRDELIIMAKDVGAYVTTADGGGKEGERIFIFDDFELEQLVARVAEECAKVCEDLWDQEAKAASSRTQEPKYHDTIECAYAIRQRFSDS